MTAVQALSIGELSARTGVGISTLRAWERATGFPAAARTTGGQRRYPIVTVEQVGRVQTERQRGLSLADAVAAVHAAAEVGDGSLYAGLRRAFPQLDVLRLGVRTMLSMTWSIEDESMAHASRPLLLGCFQTSRSFEVAGNRWRELGRTGRYSAVFSDFERTDADSTPARVALPSDSALLNEWAIVVLDPEMSAVLCAWEQPRRPGADRVFEAVLTLEPEAARHAARLLLQSTEGALPELERQLGGPLGASQGQASRATSLLHRFASYTDAAHRGA
ncbi:MerR family DNA-binding transcriptional regulator [Nocardioides acrostichi]|uniref:MerR family DNA-binding transcriptional regulator n=1 Tax=Nocardioides acrostichi TaxID=2784339 RepID=A0A930UYC4_9ACTN|nr:DICT sensory domain-containing protein [Nocardioides acrostichi]MBF4160260.1 MerR family DNA-binding transcriptional regulator [Nocardioides acrostichi]